MQAVLSPIKHNQIFKASPNLRLIFFFQQNTSRDFSTFCLCFFFQFFSLFLRYLFSAPKLISDNHKSSSSSQINARMMMRIIFSAIRNSDFFRDSLNVSELLIARRKLFIRIG